MIRTLSRGCRHMAMAAATVSVSLMLAPAAYASGSSMPWEAPLQSIQSIKGPVAKIIAVIVIISTGLALAFAASNFFLSFFSFGGGAEGIRTEHDGMGGEHPPPKPDPALPITIDQDRSVKFLPEAHCTRSTQTSCSERSAGTMIGNHHDALSEPDRFLNSAVDDSPRKRNFRYKNKKCIEFKSAFF